MAFFLDQIRVRYILPVVPILSILTVMGLINIFNWSMSRPNHLRHVWVVVLSSVFIVIMSQNIFYIKNYYQNISPMNYILGRESKDEFISRNDHSYPVIKYINKNTPGNTKIRLMLLAGRGYYLERIYEDDPTMGMDFIRGLVAASNNDKTFQNHIHSLGCTHLLVRIDLFHKFLQDNYSPDTGKLLIQRMNQTMDVIYNKDGYAVYKIISAS
jgi:hypothetical protein